MSSHCSDQQEVSPQWRVQGWRVNKWRGMSSYWNPSRAGLERSGRWETLSCTVVLSRVHTTCLHLQGSYECVGTELLALHWVPSSPPPSTASIMFSYEIMGTQQHRYTICSSPLSPVMFHVVLLQGLCVLSGCVPENIVSCNKWNTKMIIVCIFCKLTICNNLYSPKKKKRIMSTHTHMGAHTHTNELLTVVTQTHAEKCNDSVKTRNTETDDASVTVWSTH